VTAGRRPRGALWARLALACEIASVGPNLALAAPQEGWIEGILRDRATGALERAFGAKLHVGQIEVAPLSLEVRLEDVRLELPAGQGQPLRVRAERVRVRWAWEGLLAAAGGRLHLREVEADAPEVDLDDQFVAAWAARPRKGPPIEVRVDRLAVRRGRIRYQDLDQPMDFEATDVAFASGWDVYRHALVGQFTMSSSFRQAPLARPFPLEVRGGFALERRRLGLVGVRARGEGLSFELDGHATWGQGVSFQARGVLTASAEKLAPWLERDFPQIEGQLAGRFTVERYPGTPLVFRGRFEGKGVRFGPLRAERAEANVLKRASELELDDLRADSYGGTVSGRVSVALGPAARFRAAVTGSSLDLEKVLGLVGNPLPFASTARLDLELRGEARRRATWTGSGRFSCTPAPDGRRLPLAGAGTLVFGAGQFRVDSPEVDIEAASLRVGMEGSLEGPPFGLRLALKGTTRDAARTQAGLLRILEALHLAPGEIVRRPIGGQGRIEATVRVGRTADTDVLLALEGGSFDGEGFDRAVLDLALYGGEATLRAVRAERGAASIEARGRFRFSEAPELLQLEAKAKDFPLETLLPRLGLALPATGLLTGLLALHREGEGMEGFGTAQVTSGFLFGEKVERAEARIEVRQGRFSFQDLLLEGPAVRGEGLVVVRPETKEAELTIHRVRLSLPALELARSRNLGLEGEAELRGSVRVLEGGPTGVLAVRTRGVRLAAGPVDLTPPVEEEVAGEALLDPRGLELRIGAGEGSAWTLTGLVGFDSGHPFEGELVLRTAQATIHWGKAAHLQATVSGRASVSGPLETPSELALVGSLERVEVGFGASRLVSIEPLPLRIERGSVRVGPGILEGEGARLEGFVSYGATGIELDAGGRADLSLLLGSWPEFRGSGPVSLELRATGEAQNPQVSGTVRLEGARIRRLGLADGLEHVDLVARFSGDRVELERFDALLGGGEIEGKGEATLSGFGLGSYRMDLAIRDAAVRFPEGFRGVYRGALSLEGGASEATVRGRLELVEGVYAKEFEWGRLLARQNEAGLGRAGWTLPVQVRFDVELSAPGNVWIRNSAAQIECRLDLALGGRFDRPELRGRIWLYEGGSVRFRDVEYRVVSGTVDFTEVGRIEPYLDLRAQTRVSPYDVFLRIEGTAERFRYELTSDPPLSQPDIIALLLTGSPLQPQGRAGSAARPELFTGDLAANYFAGALSDRFTRQLRRVLGLERLEVNSLLVEGSADPTTRITLAKTVNEDVRLIYSADLGTTERRLYRVDWQALRNLRLSASRDTTGGVGGEVEFEKRLGGARRLPRPLTTVADETGNGPGETRAPVLASVRIEGVSAGEARELRSRIPLEEGKPVRRTDLYKGARAIREALVRRGRLEARVGAELVKADEGSPAADVLYRIEPGPRVRTELAGIGGKLRRRIARKLEQFWLEGPHGLTPYAQAAEAILEDLRSQGYYAALVEHEVREGAGERLVRYAIDPGSLVRVRRVWIEGATAFPEHELLGRLKTRPDDAFSRHLLDPRSLDEDVESLRQIYQEAGYLDVRVEEPRVEISVDGKEAFVRFPIVEGRRYKLAAVEARGSPAFAAETLVDWSGLEPGKEFSPTSLRAAESSVRSRLDAEGYPDSRVETEVRFADGSATVELRVDPGERKRIGAIEIAGLRRTRPKIVRRQLAFRVGDLLSSSSLLETQRRLYRLGLFRSVRIGSVPMEGGDPSLRAVRVELEEAAPVRIALGAGYDSEGGARGSLSVSHQNLGGYGREVAVQGKASQIERRLQFVAREPRLFNRELEALLTTFWERREQVGFTETRRASAFRIRKEMRPGWTRHLRFNFQRVDLSDVILPEALRDQKLENLKLGDLGVAVVRDRRDDLFLPTKGSYVSVEARLFAPIFLSEDSFLKVFAQASWTHSFGKAHPLTFASAVRIGLGQPFGTTPAIPLSERFFAGGDSTLRGFERDGVGPRDVDPASGASRPAGGEALLLFNEELRFPIVSRLKGVVFYDAGNVYRRLAGADPFDLRHAIGAGLRLETPIGPLRLEYGRKLDREPGESRSEVFFAIGSAF